ncbi:MAG TPA: hypothetical protein VES79_12785 [Solirubrobacteraceae bacterium]|nr:hypothetical protein [Solirubrobacteraceae bacterium]
MTVLAHAGHWLVSLAYLAPLLVLVVVVVVGKIQGRRAGGGERPPDQPEDPGSV